MRYDVTLIGKKITVHTGLAAVGARLTAGQLRLCLLLYHAPLSLLLWTQRTGFARKNSTSSEAGRWFWTRGQNHSGRCDRTEHLLRPPQTRVHRKVSVTFVVEERAAACVWPQGSVEYAVIVADNSQPKQREKAPLSAKLFLYKSCFWPFLCNENLYSLQSLWFIIAGTPRAVRWYWSSLGQRYYRLHLISIWKLLLAKVE